MRTELSPADTELRTQYKPQDAGAGPSSCSREGEYFCAKIKARKGDRAGATFVAITDPDPPLVKLAQEGKFRCTFLNFVESGTKMTVRYRTNHV